MSAICPLLSLIVQCFGQSVSRVLARDVCQTWMREYTSFLGVPLVEHHLQLTLLRIISAGQKFVKADWIKLIPTNPASANQYGDTSRAKTDETRMSVPAKTRILFSIDI